MGEKFPEIKNDVLSISFTSLKYSLLKTTIISVNGISFEETVKLVNDFREACVDGLWLKTWDSSEIAEFAIPTGVTFEFTPWSILSIFACISCIVIPLNSNERESHSKLGDKIRYVWSYFQSWSKHPCVFIFKLCLSEMTEIFIQVLYLLQISRGEAIMGPLNIRVQLYIIFTNVTLWCIAFVWAVTFFFQFKILVQLQAFF